MFQFQFGSIDREFDNLIEELYPEFQFQFGSIDSTPNAKTN